MTDCNGCGRPIEGDYGLTISEMIDGEIVWAYEFHGWKCLIRRLIERRMIEVELRPCE